jgi:hypothetical protein
METEQSVEIIGGMKVHPAASLFPLIEGEDFEDLVFSIKTLGVLQPIIVSNGVLIDGRNRLRAVTKLRQEGKTINLPTKELDPETPNICEYIFDTNAHRRNLTPDQTAMISTDVWPMIAKERDSKQAASQFKKGVSGNPTGKVKEQVTTDSPSPAPEPRDRKKSNEQSTVGQIAKLAGVSHHKARQAVAMVKAVEAGELPKETIQEVRQGTKKMVEVLPKPAPKPAKEFGAEDSSPKKKELNLDLQKELALDHIKQSIDKYLSIEYSSIRLLELAINAYLDLKKKELRK